MPGLLKSLSMLLFLGSFVCGCSRQPQQVPTNVPTAGLAPLSSIILTSDEINTSELLKVDEGLTIPERDDCLPTDCAHRVWDILQEEPLAFTDSNASLQLAISLRSFQTSEDAKSSADKIGGNAGQPGFQFIEIPAAILPEYSFAYAEDGRYVVLVTVYENILVSISISESAWKINEPEKAGTLLADAARMQIDKLTLSNQR